MRTGHRLLIHFIPLWSLLMETFGTRACHVVRRLWPLLAAVVVIALAAALWAIVSGGNPSLTMPATGVVIVTGYGDSSPTNPSTQPRSVVLTDSQAAALRRQISEIPTLKPSAGSFICMEEETVFRIAIKSADGPARTVWDAQAERCPAPGILYVHGKDAGNPEIGRYCTLKTLLLSIFPKGTANVTRKELRSC